MINKKLLPFNDYIVEQGTNYIKYDSGTMFQWGDAIVTDAIQTAHGALFRTANGQRVIFTEKFSANNPLVFLTAQANLNFAYLAEYLNNGKDGFVFYPLTVGSTSAASRSVKWFAIGKWK